MAIGIRRRHLLISLTVPFGYCSPFCSSFFGCSPGSMCQGGHFSYLFCLFSGNRPARTFRRTITGPIDTKFGPAFAAFIVIILLAFMNSKCGSRTFQARNDSRIFSACHDSLLTSNPFSILSDSEDHCTNPINCLILKVPS